MPKLRPRESAPQNTPVSKPTMTIEQLTSALNCSRAYIYAEMKKHAFPAPIKLGRKSLWLSDETDAWLAERRAQRDASRVPA